MKRDIVKHAKFYNKDGSLNLYSFMCGYIEYSVKKEITISMEHTGCVFQVKAYDFNNHKRLVWMNFESIVPARKLFLQLIKKHHNLTKRQYLENAR